MRDVIHRIYSQLQLEEMADMPFRAVLAEATFAGNALSSVNGSSPYNAVYGRVPAILPSTDRSPDATGLGTREPFQIRHTRRLREVSVQSMIEGSARERMGKALYTRTGPTAQVFG